MHVEQLKLRLRQLEDISALTQSGDTVLGRELFRTLYELNPNGNGGALASTLSPGRQTVSPAHKHWPRMSTTRSTPCLSAHTQGDSNSHRAYLTPEPTHRKPGRLAPLDVRGVVTPEPLRGGSGCEAVTTDHPSGEAVVVDVDDDQTAVVRTSMNSSPSSRHVQRTSTDATTARRTCYPESLLIRLDTVHNVDPRARASIGDLDDAIAKAKENVRQLHREVRRRQVQYENLEPGEGYLLRNRKTLEEVIQTEEQALGNERNLLQQKIASAVSERTAVQQHIAELQEKLVLLKQHVESVHAAVAVERRMERETFPSLSDQDLFGTATSVDLHHRIEAKRHAIKEAKQYLYKLRIKHTHSLTSAHRQVAKKQNELNQLQSDAILFAAVPAAPAHDEVEEPQSDGTSSYHAPFGRSPPASVLLEGVEAITDAPAPPAGQGRRESVGRKQSVRDTPPTSLELLNTIGKKQQNRRVSGEGGQPTKKVPPPAWVQQLPSDRKLRRSAIATLVRMCLESEASEREQVHTIFAESLEVLTTRMHVEQLTMEGRQCAAQSAERQRSPPRQRGVAHATKTKRTQSARMSDGGEALAGLQGEGGSIVVDEGEAPSDAQGGGGSGDTDATRAVPTGTPRFDWPELVPPHAPPNDEGDTDASQGVPCSEQTLPVVTTATDDVGANGMVEGGDAGGSDEASHEEDEAVEAHRDNGAQHRSDGSDAVDAEGPAAAAGSDAQLEEGSLADDDNVGSEQEAPATPSQGAHSTTGSIDRSNKSNASETPPAAADDVGDDPPPTAPSPPPDEDEEDIAESSSSQVEGGQAEEGAELPHTASNGSFHGDADPSDVGSGSLRSDGSATDEEPVDAMCLRE